MTKLNRCYYQLMPHTKVSVPGVEGGGGGGGEEKEEGEGGAQGQQVHHQQRTQERRHDGPHLKYVKTLDNDKGGKVTLHP